jgi:hypothetical protein
MNCTSSVQAEQVSMEFNRLILSSTNWKIASFADLLKRMIRKNPGTPTGQVFFGIAPSCMSEVTCQNWSCRQLGEESQRLAVYLDVRPLDGDDRQHGSGQSARRARIGSRRNGAS